MRWRPSCETLLWWNQWEQPVVFQNCLTFYIPGVVGEKKISIFIKSWVGLICQAEGLCHAINGGSTWVWFDLIRSFMIESSIPNFLGKCSKNSDSLGFGEVIEVRICCDWNGKQIFFVSVPSKSLLLWGGWFHCVACGCCSSKHVSQEDISWGIWQSLDPFGTWQGTEDWIKFVRSESERRKSLEQVSDILLNFPGNHWL